MKIVFENHSNEETANKIAELHADLVKKQLDEMNLTQTEKLEILDAILNSYSTNLDCKNN